MVVEGAGGGEVCVFEESDEGGTGEFVTVFGVDGFTLSQVQGESGSGGVGGNVDGLGDEGFEVHLDAGGIGVPASDVAEAGEIEVGAEVAIEAGEDVAVEGGGDALGVVVGADESGD